MQGDGGVHVGEYQLQLRWPLGLHEEFKCGGDEGSGAGGYISTRKTEGRGGGSGEKSDIYSNMECDMSY